MKLAVIGPAVWFSSHFPEHWHTDPAIRCFDVNEADYRFLIKVYNYRPDVSLFFRPELYPPRFLDQIPGLKLGFLSEPIPQFESGRFLDSEETALRLRVYSRMSWASFDKTYFYDASKRLAARRLGWPITKFRPLPIDTSRFHTIPRADRPIDVFFVGKATPHRIRQLDFLRNARLKFRWIAHGIMADELAVAFQRSKVVLNIHADGLPALEPRISLAAMCGAYVLSERLDGDVFPFGGRVREYENDLSQDLIEEALKTAREETWSSVDIESVVSARKFLSEEAGFV